jgi:hypothetical protein
MDIESLSASLAPEAVSEERYEEMWKAERPSDSSAHLARVSDVSRLHEEMVIEFFAHNAPQIDYKTRPEIAAYIKLVLEQNKAFHIQRAHRHGKSSRKELILHARDLRKLDLSTFEDAEPFMLVRKHVILLRFSPVRAIILKDRCMLLLPEGADAFLSPIKMRLEDFSGSLQPQDASKYEFRAIEAILEATCADLRRSVEKIAPRVEVAMKNLRVITTTALENMRRVKNRIDEIQSHAAAVSRYVFLCLVLA